MTRLIKYFLYLLTIYFCQSTLIAQQSKTDSLITLLKTDKEDSNKVIHSYKLCREFINTGNYDTAMILGKQGLALGLKLDFKNGIADSYNYIGIVYRSQGNYPEALKNYFAALKTQEAIGDKLGISNSYNNIGNVYDSQGNYPEALKNHFAALKIREAIGDKQGIAGSYLNIGIVYDSQGNYPEAIKNYFASLKIFEAIGEKAGIAYSYNSIGSVYESQGNHPEALKNQFASLKIEEALGDKDAIATSYNNIGNIYNSQGNYPEALTNHFASLKIREAIGNKAGIAMSCLNIGAVFTIQKKYNEAEEYLTKAKMLSKEIGYKEALKGIYNDLTELDSAKGNFKSAYENHKLYILYRDSIDNEATRKKTLQSQMTFDFEKKEAATQAEQDKKDVIANEELKQKEQQRNYFIAGFVLVGLLSIFILRGYKQKQKANLLLENKNKIIEEKQKEIIDSITYARRIQRSLLPTEKYIDKNLDRLQNKKH